mmetsp:Transcript_18156/g.29835  ORF Transcript_18156/g.29835 Transcript_18156/m.29835 type:complete len:152 (-) Transcript_18156:316-771(-)
MVFSENGRSSPYLERNERLVAQFRLPADELLRYDFVCSQGKITERGHLYVFEHFITFKTTFLGQHDKHEKIAFEDVVGIQKTTSGLIFSTLEIIVRSGKKYTFGSFSDRDVAYEALKDEWWAYKEALARGKRQLSALVDRPDQAHSAPPIA